MLRNPKKEEDIDEESGDESPLIVPRHRNSDGKKKSSASSSCSPLALIVMLALVVGISVGTYVRFDPSCKKGGTFYCLVCFFVSPEFAESTVDILDTHSGTPSPRMARSSSRLPFYVSFHCSCANVAVTRHFICIATRTSIN